MGGSSFNSNDLTDPNDKTNKQKKSNTVYMLIRIENSVLIFISLFFMGCSSGKNFTTFSKQIYKAQKGKKKCGVSPKLSFESRKKLADTIDFIDYSNDTVYCLESYYIETGEYYGAIWTKKGTVEFKVHLNNLEYGQNFFIKRLYKMIENWDLPALRKAERESDGMFGGGVMSGAKVIIDQGDFRMDCVQFDEFFNLQLDRK